MSNTHEEAREILKNIHCVGCLDEDCKGIYDGESIHIALKAYLDARDQKHQREVEELREAIENAITRVRVNHPSSCACSSCDFNHHQASAKQQMLKAFDAATHLNPKS